MDTDNDITVYRDCLLMDMIPTWLHTFLPESELLLRVWTFVLSAYYSWGEPCRCGEQIKSRTESAVIVLRVQTVSLMDKQTCSHWLTKRASNGCNCVST